MKTVKDMQMLTTPKMSKISFVATFPVPPSSQAQKKECITFPQGQSAALSPSCVTGHLFSKNRWLSDEGCVRGQTRMTALKRRPVRHRQQSLLIPPPGTLISVHAFDSFSVHGDCAGPSCPDPQPPSPISILRDPSVWSRRRSSCLWP